MDAWADGLNYYLATHPEVKPRVITRFEPWMALSFTEGSIGGDIERIVARRSSRPSTARHAATHAPSRRRTRRLRQEPTRLERHRHRAVEHRRRSTRCC